jgi:hypothetical protein
MRAPSVCPLFLIFIGKHWLKSPAMEIQSDNIGGSEPRLRKIGEKEFVDHAFAGLADAALLLRCRVGGYYHAAMAALWSYRDIGAVVERSHERAFWTTEVGIGRQVEPRLDGRVIQYCVVFTSHHEAEAFQICDDGPSAVEAVQPQQSACLRKAVGREIAADGCERMCQLLPVLSVASLSERAEPLRGVGMRNDGAGANNFSSLAPSVARGTDLIEPSLSSGEIFHLR